LSLTIAAGLDHDFHAAFKSALQFHGPGNRVMHAVGVRRPRVRANDASSDNKKTPGFS